MKIITTIALVLMIITANAQSCPDGYHPHMIDLGLPSGTKWACCNVDAYMPEMFGSYYAWGETTSKFDYSAKTYKYCRVVGIEYVFNYTWTDIAGTIDDVAHVKWGGDCKMPTIDQIKELCDKCTVIWTQYKGVNGLLFMGKNHNSIFLPAADYKKTQDDGVNSSFGYYWSSTLSPYGRGDEAFNFRFDEYTLQKGNDQELYRPWGCCIRPVSKSGKKPNFSMKAVEVADSCLFTTTSPSTNHQKGYYTITDKDKLYDSEELTEQPSYPGGQSALLSFLAANIHYPHDAEEKGIQGKVVVSFVVEPDGSISNVAVVRSVHPLLDIEAIRIIMLMSAWTPGKVNGIPVPVKYNLPITFKVQ